MTERNKAAFGWWVAAGGVALLSLLLTFFLYRTVGGTHDVFAANPSSDAGWDAVWRAVATSLAAVSVVGLILLLLRAAVGKPADLLAVPAIAIIAGLLLAAPVSLTFSPAKSCNAQAGVVPMFAVPFYLINPRGEEEAERNGVRFPEFGFHNQQRSCA